MGVETVKLTGKCARAAITHPRVLIALLSALVVTFGFVPVASAQSDPLPSWNDGKVKQSIIDFVTRVTKKDGPDYVEPEERVATFENAGTLWTEQPVDNQFAFALY